MKRLIAKFPNDMAILAISYDRQREDIDAFIKASVGSRPIFISPGIKKKKTSEVFGTDVLPKPTSSRARASLSERLPERRPGMSPWRLSSFKIL